MNDKEEFSDIFSRAYTYLLENAAKVIAFITAAVAALVTFTDISFGGIGSESFTSSLIVMLIASYLIYFSLEDIGRERGEKSERYKEAASRYESACERISGEQLPRLREYCFNYSRDDLIYRVKNYIGLRGYSEKQLEEYRSGEIFDERAKRVFKRALRMRPLSLSPGQLLSPIKSSSSPLVCPAWKRRADTLLRLIPSTLGTIFTVSLVLTAKDGLGAPEIIEGILKLSALPLIGFKGYKAGFFHVKERESAYLCAKAGFLEGFLKAD